MFMHTTIVARGAHQIIVQVRRYTWRTVLQFFCYTWRTALE